MPPEHRPKKVAIGLGFGGPTDISA